MAVRIRMKRIGRKHRPFFRICAADRHNPRDGRVLEELGTYDLSIEDTDARAVLNNERIDYWLSVGAQPSDNVAVLIKKYGTNGTHTEQHRAAVQRLSEPKQVVDAGAPASLPNKPEETPAETETAAAEKPAAEAEAPAEAPAAEASAETPAAESAEQAVEQPVEQEKASADKSSVDEAEKTEAEQPKAE